MQPDIATGSNRIDWLTRRLMVLGAEQSVRVIEALAAALANQLETSSEDGAIEAPCLAEAAAAFEHDAGPDQRQRAEVCRRVARRALHRSLADPTCGANAFHHIDEEADWARGHLPVSIVGPYLFYRASFPLLRRTKDAMMKVEVEANVVFHGRR
jgi:hypothetical protein